MAPSQGARARSVGAGGGGTALREPERRCHYSLVPARVCFSNFTKLKAVDCGMFRFLMWLVREFGHVSRKRERIA